MPSSLPPISTSTAAANGHATPSHSSGRLTKLTNAYLVLPNGDLTSATSSIWVDPQSGRITRIDIGEVDDEVSGNPLDDGMWTGKVGSEAVRSSQSHTGTPESDTIDLAGQILAPGLIDVQINGAFGVDFSAYDGDETAYRAGVAKVARGLVQTGVTAFVPTIIVGVPTHRTDCGC